jgi:hypothetical protein
MKGSLAALFILSGYCQLTTPLAFGQSSLSNQSTVRTIPSAEAKDKPFYKNIFAGAKASIGMWQVPAFAISLLTERQRPGHGVSLPPLEMDHEIAEDWSRNDGKLSLGAIDPEYYPHLMASSRLAGMIVLDAVGGQDYSPTSYTKMFRFQQALYFNTVVTHLAKRNFNRFRPDRSDTQSFFSGHTSTAFATSTFLYLEVRDLIDGQTLQGRNLPLLSPSQWKTVSFGILYGWASYVGFSRIHDNKHYLSDVLVGAASGTLVSYLLYPHQDKSPAASKMKFGIVPMRNGSSVGLSYNF